MSSLLNKEVAALKRIYVRNSSPLTAGYVSAWKAYFGDELRLYVFIDGYQLVLDHTRNASGWDVDQWEKGKCVVFWGVIRSCREFRLIMTTARRAARDMEMLAMGLDLEKSPFRPLVRDIKEREEHRAQRHSRKLQEGINHG